MLAGGVRLSRVGHDGKAQAWCDAGAVVVKEDGGGERARGAGRRFRVVTVEDVFGCTKSSDSESEGEEVMKLETDGGEMVDLDGVHPLGDNERELELDELEEVEDRLTEKLVKASMLIFG